MPVQFLKEVGPQRAELLEKLGIETVQDLLFTIPRGLLDLTVVTPVRELEEKEVHTVRGRVVDLDGKEISRQRTITSVLLDCDGEFLRGTWFNQTWVLRSFHMGQTVLFSGKPKYRAGRWEMNHPRVQYLDDDDAEAAVGVLPIYALTEGLKMHEMRRIMSLAVEEYADTVFDPLPKSFQADHDWVSLPAALRGVHRPRTVVEFNRCRSRLAYDDLLEFQLALGIRRRSWKKRPDAYPLEVTAKIDARIRRLFPFPFTAGQNHAVKEIAADLNSHHVMHRLLQADVGAGKTAVAVYAMLTAVAHGCQTALMAPTELLAMQHWETIDQLLVKSRVRRRLFTGSLTPAQRRDVLAEISAGTVDLIIGTQSVIQRDVRFAKLGLVVIDEQHKFGVKQRAQISIGSGNPHVLVMTATPIPRSLCMTLFGDLDLTVIGDLPPGRQSVVTSRVYQPNIRQRAWQFIREQVANGRQAYVVCPRVSEGDVWELEDESGGMGDGETGRGGVQEFEGGHVLTATAAEQVFLQLKAGELKNFRLGLVHGQMKRDETDRVMQGFREGKIQVLVSTTVIEVGVDVPNATLMVILDAERFGLSQLHQLRGRVARGRYHGYCFLFSESSDEDAIRRLSALEATSNGFQIAETDFELRGPGDVLGTRQHGQLPFRIANLAVNQTELQLAKDQAAEILESGQWDDPEYAELKAIVTERFGELMNVAQTG